jgi:hypothetical protein
MTHISLPQHYPLPGPELHTWHVYSWTMLLETTVLTLTELLFINACHGEFLSSEGIACLHISPLYPGQAQVLHIPPSSFPSHCKAVIQLVLANWNPPHRQHRATQGPVLYGLSVSESDIGASFLSDLTLFH